MQVYNDEHLYHFGIKGMHWGKKTASAIKKSNDDYKTKINKIANSKSAHKADVEAAKKVNSSLGKRIGTNVAGAALSTVLGDVFTGQIKNYKYMSTTDIIKKAGDISRKAAANMAIDEATARSVANKYNTKGERIKGSNNSRFTREQVAKTAISTTTTVAPFVAAIGILKLGQMARQKKAGEEAFAKWGSRILTEKVKDYSNYIPNVNYSVK